MTGARIAIAVYQFAPGKRLRTPFELVGADPPESFTEAAIPVLMPFLVEIARLAALQSDQAVKAFEEPMARRVQALTDLIRS